MDPPLSKRDLFGQTLFGQLTKSKQISRYFFRVKNGLECVYFFWFARYTYWMGGLEQAVCKVKQVADM